MTWEELLAAYREQAVVYGRAAEAGDHERGNQAQEALLDIRRALRRAQPERIRDFLALLDDEQLEVRLSAGIDALEFSPIEGERVLEAIAAGPRGMIRFEAAQTLAAWKNGEFTVPWWQQ